MSTTDLTGKVAVVTGAGRGVGRAVALALAGAGAHVALVARGRMSLDEAAAEIASSSGQASVFPADVSSPDSVAALRDSIARSLGAPQILVNAAGIFGPIKLIKDSEPDPWLETIKTNLFGPYLTCRAFAADMIATGWGRIVNVTSAAALHPPGPLSSAYGTSKVALNQFTRHLAAELAGTGVTANVFHPGDVKTEMWADIRDKANAMGPDGAAYRQWVIWVGETGGDPPHKSADLVLRLMSSDADGTNGQFLWIEDGLQAPIPSWGDVADARPWSDS